eukprot:6944171-Prymnesium_polylepis.1
MRVAPGRTAQMTPSRTPILPLHQAKPSPCAKPPFAQGDARSHAMRSLSHIHRRQKCSARPSVRAQRWMIGLARAATRRRPTVPCGRACANTANGRDMLL